MSAKAKCVICNHFLRIANDETDVGENEVGIDSKMIAGWFEPDYVCGTCQNVAADDIERRNKAATAGG